MLLLLLSDEASPPLNCIELVLFLEPLEESLLLESPSLLEWLRDLAFPFNSVRWSSFYSFLSSFSFAFVFLISLFISCIIRAYLYLVLFFMFLPKLSKFGTAFCIISIVYSSSLDTSLESLLVELLWEVLLDSLFFNSGLFLEALSLNLFSHITQLSRLFIAIAS